ncbi:MAG: hypothetical protein WC584_03520 [Candidatus Pacearchaeota archaeon]
MEELLENIQEFIESGEENLRKQRFNAAVSDFFKAIVIICDYLIYKEIKIIPKNHNERFSILEKYFRDTYKKVAELFQIYIKSYNSRSTKEEAQILKKYAYEIKQNITNKKQT